MASSVRPRKAIKIEPFRHNPAMITEEYAETTWALLQVRPD